MRAGAVDSAASVLSAAPGLLLRQASAAERAVVVGDVTGAIGSASGRVLCSLREHVGNWLTPASARMYANRSRRAWVGPDARPPLPAELVEELSALLDAERSAPGCRIHVAAPTTAKLPRGAIASPLRLPPASSGPASVSFLARPQHGDSQDRVTGARNVAPPPLV